jgi:hypothetical protein
MRHIIRSLLVLGIAGGSAACSGGAATAVSSSQVTASRLAGNWANVYANSQSSSGITVQMTLVSEDSTVSGSGRWVSTNNGSGTLSVTGSTSGDNVELDLSFSDGSHWHFSGTMLIALQLHGIWYPVPGGDPLDVTFRRYSNPAI